MTGGTLTLAVFDERSGWSLPERHGARLAELAGDAWTVRTVSTRAQLLEALGETVGLVGMPLTEEQIERHLGRLRWVQLARSSGDASAAIATALAGGVRISSAGSVRAPFVAEHALALTLAQLRRVDSSVARQREHIWASHEIASGIRSLIGATLCVVASPALVREVAVRVRACGASCVACAAGAPGVERVLDDEVDRAFEIGALNEAVSGADVVIVGAPRTPSTLGLIGKKTINAMKRGAVFVDVSKGGVVDQNALVDALRKDRIAGAAMDVFATEPLPPTSPFWTMPNVIVTPHVAAVGEGFWDRLIEQAGENARRAVVGEALIDELAPAMYAVA